MRFATIRTGAGTTAARLDGDSLVPLDAPDVGALLDVVSVAVYLAQWSPIDRIVADAYLLPASLSMPTVSGAELGVMPFAKNDTW